MTNSELVITSRAEDLIKKAEQSIRPAFLGIQETVNHNQKRILHAFQISGISAGHMQPSTGYGYSDIGRDALEKVFSCAFGCEDALVRPHIVSGTHALSIGLNGLLKRGQTLVSVTGKPYDTLERVIGIEPSAGSLMERGVNYKVIDLLPSGNIDLEGLEQTLRSDRHATVIFLQRSAGYAWRRALRPDEIGDVANLAHGIRPDCTVFVDNCYGEFTDIVEPTHCGADLIAGSLIKNPGGGLAPTGGYLCGRKSAIERVESALTAPGIGRTCGSYEATYRPFYQGLFLAPHIVGEAMKTSVLFAHVFSQMGYRVMPETNDKRYDIIQAIEFNNRGTLLSFCRAIQNASPVDAMAIPEPWVMPGYTHEVVMAAGTFVQGASIELSADAPLCKPYIGYLQGSLTYAHGRIACMMAVDALTI